MENTLIKASPFNIKGPMLHQVVFVYPDHKLSPFFLAAFHTCNSCLPHTFNVFFFNFCTTPVLDCAFLHSCVFRKLSVPYLLQGSPLYFQIRWQVAFVSTT